MNSSPAHPQQEWQFSGFVFPTTTPVPDQLFDELLHRLSGAELKVLLYIVRRTFGFKKQSDDISLAQLVKGIKTKEGKVLDQGTGLGKSSVVRALNSLEQKNIILRVRRRSEQKGNEATTYTLNITPLSQKETRVVPKVIQGLSHQRDTQQTVRQQTVKQQQAESRKNADSSSDNGDLAAALIDRGIDKKVAHRLANSYDRQRIEDNLDWFEWKQNKDPHSIKTNPAGLLCIAIKKDFASEGHKGFQTRRQKAAASLAKKQRLQVQERLICAREQQQAVLAQQKETERVKRLEKLREQYHTGKQEGVLWLQVLETLKKQIPKVSFNAYLAASELLSLQQDKVLIAVPNRFVQQQIEGRLLKKIQQTLGDHLKGQAVTIQCLALGEAQNE